MPFFKFILLASFVGGCYGISVQCLVLSRYQCEDFDSRLPVAAQELRYFCQNLIPFAYCVLGVVQECAEVETFPDDERDVEEFRRTVDFIQSSCSRENDVFRVVKENLSCMTSTMDTMDEICHWTGLNDEQKAKLYRLVEEEPKHCVLDAWVFYCMSAQFDSECGSEAGDVVSQILDYTDYVSHTCRKMRQRLAYFEDIFKSEFRLQKEGQQALRGIFKALARKVN